MSHTHQYRRSKPSATVETCRCGKFRFTEHAGPPIVGQPIPNQPQEPLQGQVCTTGDKGYKDELGHDEKQIVVKQTNSTLKTAQ